jgi:hypothetical protein
MARPKKVKKMKKEFKLSEEATKLITKLHDLITKEVTKHDKKAQKDIKK